MKVLLIRPRPERESIGLQSFMICEPLEFEYVASYLEQHGHEVTILDMILERESLPRLLRSDLPESCEAPPVSAKYSTVRGKFIRVAETRDSGDRSNR